MKTASEIPFDCGEVARLSFEGRAEGRTELKKCRHKKAGFAQWRKPAFSFVERVARSTFV
jgi:hypothetical protein